MVVSTTTARADIFKEFRAVIVANMATANINVVDAFSETEILQGDNRLIVINAPAMMRERMAFGMYNREGSIEIEIYGEKLQEVVELYDDVENAIFGNLSDLGVQNVRAGDSTPAQIELTGKTLHVLVIPITFKFYR